VSKVIDGPSNGSDLIVCSNDHWDSLYGSCQVCQPTVVLKIIMSHCEPLPENGLIRMQVSTNIEMGRNRW